MVKWRGEIIPPFFMLSQIGHAQALAEMRQCSLCEDREIPAGAVVLGLGSDLTRSKYRKKLCRRKDMSVLGTALRKTFHFLRQRRHGPRAGNERRMPGARSCPSGAGEGLLSGSWQWGKLSNELPLKLCKRHSVTRPGWQVPVVLPVHISNSPGAQASHFPKTSHKARQGWQHDRFSSAKPN